MIENALTVRARDLILNGHKMHYWMGGSGPALLLLHAAWGDAELSWNRVWDELSRSYTILAPDLPGFGGSSPLAEPSLVAMAKILKELLDALKIDRVMVAGNSLSAAVSIQLANSYPRTVSRLILVNGGYMPVIPRLTKKLIAWPMVNYAFRRIVRKATFSQQTLNRSFADLASLPSGFIEKIHTNSFAYSGISFDTIMNLTEPMRKPAVPALVVWGAQDGLATMKQAEALQKWMPEATLITINGAGHMPQVERPQEFVAAINGTMNT
jgi:pimeloyl-ACP methyl ester carboxylesterase